MVEFTALILAVGILMFFLLQVTFNLGENYDVLKAFLILVSMLLGLVIAHLGKLIAVEQATSTAIQDTLDIVFYVWVVICVVVLSYFLLMFIIKAWNLVAAKKKQEINFYEEGEAK